MSKIFKKIVDFLEKEWQLRNITFILNMAPVKIFWACPPLPIMNCTYLISYWGRSSFSGCALNLHFTHCKQNKKKIYSDDAVYFCLCRGCEGTAFCQDEPLRDGVVFPLSGIIWWWKHISLYIGQKNVFVLWIPKQQTAVRLQCMN